MNCACCGSRIWGERALATGYGEGCRRKVYRGAKVLAASGHPVALRAAVILLRPQFVRLRHKRVWAMPASKGSRVYLAAANTCTCDGATYRPTANTCKHSVAAAVLAA